MSGDEDFLSRWSRRKRAASEPMPPPEEAADEPATLPSSGEAAAAPDDIGKVDEEEAFDLASLPPVDSIVAGTDISGFLKRGVPLDLTRAALRRAWSTDPAIRDFVGLAENAWDFNDPNAMPGFGPLDQSPEELRQMLARVMGEIRRDAEATEPSDNKVPVAQSAKVSDAAAGMTGADGPADEPAADDEANPQAAPEDVIPVQSQADTAAQHQQPPDAAEIGERPMLRRTHGGALPR